MMPNVFFNWWSGGVDGVIGDVLFQNAKLEFMMPNVFLNWWSGGVTGDVLF